MKRTTQDVCQQYVNCGNKLYIDVQAMFCKVADVYGKSAIKGNFVKNVDSSTTHRMREYWATQPREEVAKTTFETQ